MNSRMRARDLDRTTAIDALDRAYADGQLGYEEHSARMANARAAKTLGELHSLISDLQLSTDLPEPPPVPRRRQRRLRWWVVAGLIIVAGAGVLIWATTGSDDSPTVATQADQPVAPPAPV